ncbi:MAG: serine hydrolase domain-containing protein [Polyangiaceae bacterium]
MKLRIELLALLALTFSCAGQSFQSDATETEKVRCERLDFSAVDAAIAEFLMEQGLPGAGSVIVDRECGSVHLSSYGAFEPDRVYLLGSSSKVVSVGVMMELADRGLLDLDAPLGGYVSAWPGPGKPELSVAQLVSNSSGLVGLVDNPIYAPYLCQYRSGGTLRDCAEAIYSADDASTRIAPDAEFHYGGGQWQLAGGVAEEVANESWSQLVSELYGARCGATSIGYTNPFSLGGGVASALRYPDSFQGDVSTLPNTQNPNVEGGLYANVADYGKLLLMHLRGGLCDGTRALSEQAALRMREDRIGSVYGGTTAGMSGRTTGASAFSGYGLGWWVDREHPGVFADPGLYGAFPWLDVERGYAAFVALEADSGEVGGALYARIKPLVDAAFEQAR